MLLSQLVLKEQNLHHAEFHCHLHKILLLPFLLATECMADMAMYGNATTQPLILINKPHVNVLRGVNFEGNNIWSNEGTVFLVNFL